MADTEEPGAEVEAPEVVEPEEMGPVEELAVEMGWKPKSQYTGDPEKWKPARDFVRAERDVSRGLRETVKGLQSTVERMATAHDRQMARALADQAKAIEAKHAKAVEDGDQAAANAAVREMRELDRSAVSANNPEDQFASENPWYGKDEDATAYAVAVSQREAGKGASIPQQLKAAREAVEKRFPELFETKPAQRNAPPVNAPSSRAAPKSKGNTFADLPADARRACESNMKLFKEKFGQDPEVTKANYLRDFYGPAAA